MKEFVFKRLKLFIYIFSATLLFDQITKIIVSVSMSLYQSISVIKGFFHITYIENTGFLMGIGGWMNNGRTFNGVVIITIFAILILMGYFFILMFKEETPHYLIINFSILIGGAWGNFIDRIVRKKVVDFMEFKIPPLHLGGFSFHSFPIFNFADFFVSTGIIMLLIYYLFLEKKYVKKQYPDLNEIQKENQ